MVRERVPKGSVIIYFMNRSETWEFGLWKRSLYPDYVVLSMTDPNAFKSPQFVALRDRYHVRYVLLANTPLSGVRDSMALPDYPNGSPMALAELEN